jgi:AAA domain/DnaB-like helicase N terminal domain
VGGMSEAVAPQNLAAEESLLGAIMVAGARGAEASAKTLANVRASGIEPDDFFRESHRIIFSAALDLAERGEPTDVIVLEAELGARGQLVDVGGAPRIHELAALARATANAGHYAGLVVDAADRRAQFEAALVLRQAALNGGLAANPEVREQIDRALSSSSRSRPGRAAPWSSQPWSVFRSETPEQHEWLVEGLLPAGMLAFVAGPPKKGKTWLGLGLALAVATGTPLFGAYTVPEPRAVLYVALEGSRVGIRARIGALARGHELDPDGDDLGRLNVLYRPRPFDLAELATATWLREHVEELDAALVIVDVLRAAARFQENVAEDFAVVRDGLEPLLAAGRTVPLLHHFGKLTETQKERSPGERMAGTGAMYGALDVGFLITKSEAGARRLRVDVEARDFAAPDALGVVILGEGSGEHGGFTYADDATLALDPTAAEGRDLAAEMEALFRDDRWRTVAELASREKGIGANKDELEAVLVGSPDRFVQVEPRRVGRHATAKPWGAATMLRAVEAAEAVEVDQAPGLPGLPSPPSAGQLQVEQVAPPKGGEPVEPPAPRDGQLASAAEPPRPADPDEEELDRLAELAREAQEDVAPEAGEEGANDAA